MKDNYIRLADCHMRFTDKSGYSCSRSLYDYYFRKYRDNETYRIGNNWYISTKLEDKINDRIIYEKKKKEIKNENKY